MTKQEILDKINLLLVEAKMDEANAKTKIDKMFFIGKQNGLLWAQIWIIDLKENKDD